MVVPCTARSPTQKPKKEGSGEEGDSTNYATCNSASVRMMT